MTETADAVKQAIEDGHRTTSEVASALGYSRGYINAKIHELLDEGEVDRVKRGREYHYNVPSPATDSDPDPVSDNGASGSESDGSGEGELMSRGSFEYARRILDDLERDHEALDLDFSEVEEGGIALTIHARPIENGGEDVESDSDSDSDPDDESESVEARAAD